MSARQAPHGMPRTPQARHPGTSEGHSPRSCGWPVTAGSPARCSTRAAEPATTHCTSRRSGSTCSGSTWRRPRCRSRERELPIAARTPSSSSPTRCASTDSVGSSTRCSTARCSTRSITRSGAGTSRASRRWSVPAAACTCSASATSARVRTGPIRSVRTSCGRRSTPQRLEHQRRHGGPPVREVRHGGMPAWLASVDRVYGDEDHAGLARRCAGHDADPDDHTA